jgi:hypothetical protein
MGFIHVKKHLFLFERAIGAIIIPVRGKRNDYLSQAEQISSNLARQSYHAAFEPLCPTGITGTVASPKTFQCYQPRGAQHGLHYEFLADKQGCGYLDIHIERDSYRNRQGLLETWAEELAEEFPSAAIAFDPKWFARRAPSGLSPGHRARGLCPQDGASDPTYRT